MGGLRDALSAGFKGASGVVGAGIEARIQEKRDNAIALFRHNLGKDERAAAVELEQTRYDESLRFGAENRDYDRNESRRGEFSDKVNALVARRNELLDNFATDQLGVDTDSDSYKAAKAMLDEQTSALTSRLVSLSKSNPEYAKEFGIGSVADDSEADGSGITPDAEVAAEPESAPVKLGKRRSVGSRLTEAQPETPAPKMGTRLSRRSRIVDDQPSADWSLDEARQVTTGQGRNRQQP